MPETAKERYLRNHQERINTMKALRRGAERRGDTEFVLRISEIIKAWEGVATVAREEPDHAD